MKPQILSSDSLSGLFYNPFNQPSVVYVEKPFNKRKKTYDEICDKFLHAQSWLEQIWLLRYFFRRKFIRHFSAYVKKQRYIDSIFDVPDKMHPVDKDRQNYTFNRFFSFIRVFDKTSNKYKLFYAPRIDINKKPNWKPLYFEGMTDNDLADISQMIADGCNLKILVKREDHGEIFYKRTHKEKKHDGKIYAYNLCDTVTAKIEHFTLPFLKYFKFNQLGQRLRIPLNALWASSHAGWLKGYTTDLAKKIYNIWRVTTDYVINNRIELNDSFVESGSVYSLQLQDNNIPLQADACESTIFFLHKKEDGKYFIRYRYLDYDSLGLNPIISTLELRHYPMSVWDNFDLPEVEEIYSHITAVQRGEGNEGASILINAKVDGQVGMLSRSVNAEHWQFTPTDRVSTNKLVIGNPTGQASTHFHFNAKNVEWSGEIYTSISCENFNPEHDHNTFKVLKDGKESTFFLVKRNNMIWSFLGYNGDYWQISEDPRSANGMLPMFANEKRHDVDIALREEQLDITIKNNHKNAKLSLPHLP